MANIRNPNSTYSKKIKTRELLERNFPGCNPVVEMMRLAVNERNALENGEVVPLEELVEILHALKSDDPELEKKAKREYKEVIRKLTASKQFTFEVFKEVAQYVSPKLKSIEQKIDDSTRRAVIVTSPQQNNPVEWEKAAQVNNEIVREMAKDAMDDSTPEED